MRSAKSFVTAGTAYVLDSRSGRRRRHVLHDRANSVARKLPRLVRKKAQHALGKTRGLWAATRRAVVRPQVDTADDVVEQRIRSEVFRDVGVPPAAVEIEVVDGVVTLTGCVAGDRLASDLVARIRKVTGVEDVAAVLHVVEEEPVAAR